MRALGPRSRWTRVLTAIVLGASLALTGCGGDEPEDTDTSSDEPKGGQDPARSPLTGLKLGGKKPRHPILVTKIDNTAAAAPQSGLGAADMVVEELVESGVTRLAAFYYAELPGRVGPVRSMRTSDIGIVGPARATLITSGAAGETIARVQEASIPFFSEGSRGFSRDSSRAVPYNLFVDLSDLVKDTGGPRVPPPYLDFGTAADLPKGKPATSISTSFGNRTTEWSYTKGGYNNTNSYAAEPERFTPVSVLVLRVKVTDAGYVDPLGNFVPETTVVGTGDAVLFHAGKAISATWKKRALDSPLKLTAEGKPLSVPAGKTWISLVPEENGGVDYRK